MLLRRNRATSSGVIISADAFLSIVEFGIMSVTISPFPFVCFSVDIFVADSQFKCFPNFKILINLSDVLMGIATSGKIV